MNADAEYFSWYPGHIAKAEKELRTKWIPLLDVVIELVDARVPISGQYQQRDLFRNKPIITVYTKGDLSNFTDNESLIIDARSRSKWKQSLHRTIQKHSTEVQAKLKSQGRNRKLRLGVCGLPNVGKSTFLNTFRGQGKKAKTGNLPGVTRQMQFITGQDYDMLDSPGICPVKLPKAEAYKLMLCQLLPDKLFDTIEVAQKLHSLLLDKGMSPPKHIPTTESEALLLIKLFRQGQYRISLD